MVVAPVAWASEESEGGAIASSATGVSNSEYDSERISTTVADWLAQLQAYQLAQAQVAITGVRVNAVETGLAVVLETQGELQVPETSVVGNALIADLPNAVLALPGEEPFEQFAPAEGIALVSVANRPEGGVRISITGTDAPPIASVSTDASGLVLAVEPGTEAVATDEDAIQVVVTGEQEEDYIVEEATTATRTDTPLRDIPQSIQVVPQQVLEDQQAIRLQDALRNVSGVIAGNTFGNTSDAFVIRGFPATSAGNILRNGFRLPETDLAFFDTANIERLEVLKGPASVLYGNLEPGGVINIVTEDPLLVSAYEIQLQAGSFGFVRPTIDLTGPLNENRTLAYRLNAVFERANGFRDYDQDIRRFYVAPTLAWQAGDRTDLTVDFEYLYDERPFDRGIINDANFEIPDVPFDRIFGEPDDVSETETLSIGYELEHELSDRWELRNAFRYVSSDVFNYRAEPLYDTDAEGNLSRNFRSNDNYSESYSLQTNVVGNFTTGPIEHTLLAGVDWFRNTRTGGQSRFPGVTILNIFDPVYEVDPRPDLSELTLDFFTRNTRSDLIGFYLQDQVAFTDNLKLLAGGRFDIVDQRSNEIWLGTRSEQNETAFSPRVGLVYQPIEPVSLYASFSRSFSPNAFTDVNGDFLEPERGTQFEIGVRGELLDGRLVANLAAYDITKTNLATQDRENPDFSVATGEVLSQGIELDVIGEILPGWNIIASYAYNDARVTEDNDPERIGLRLQDAAYNTFSIWSTYEIQRGALEGLGLGAGVFYVGDRIDGFIPSVTLDGYVRVDLGVFYRRDNWETAVNIKNLLDVDYIQSGFYNPGEPLTVIGSISVEF
ncbi:MAG: TonB-dependent siderophore receptor [Synechococcales bacterium]|nr:TonB-dependent siderophore receptor [Synechococcales bacterium]